MTRNIVLILYLAVGASLTFYLNLVYPTSLLFLNEFLLVCLIAFALITVVLTARWLMAFTDRAKLAELGAFIVLFGGSTAFMFSLDKFGGIAGTPGGAPPITGLFS